MRVRQAIAAALIAASASFGAVACTIEGAGTRSECDVSGCLVTFTRGVDAKASILGVDAELVAVQGNLVTLRVAGQELNIPAGETREAEGLDVAVQEVSEEKVVIKFSTGLN
ncbi:hypothetical protein IU433_24375 [Nocardia puris]|uniref:Uncharacterized protein n=1 Tax=Nocardia puris TaxID=208602 RepID=A0A366DJF3_9NOCA|nr:hypothetical protein [Nocardia puris]MBF6213272.1 hypothetical protein [Nocardia puris]MBF6369864.1 hypothetical protein [Nocardia puris]MBF6462151.1 hypothetical protein [Nocardia puris]RBO89454.1 hypothetical protein DFR74_107132 [Nocardia puris]